MRPYPALVLLLLLAWPPRPAIAADVTIYRCIGANGRLTLRDTPCAKGERQETRTMLRPKDAPPRPATRRPARPEPAAERTRVVVAYPPRPLYECSTPDGERYTSDSSEGNPRWVPLWTLGYPVYPVYPREHAGVDFRIRNRHVDISGGRHVDTGPGYGRPGHGGPGYGRPGYGGPIYPAAAYGAGTWIRDTCHALPQAEVCDTLVDRRDVIRRRFFNAMPSERDVLRVEERGINARLDNDCGAY